MSGQAENPIPDEIITTDHPRSVLDDVVSRGRRRRGPTAVGILWQRFRQLSSAANVMIRDWLSRFRQQLITAGFSFGIHLILFVLLALWILPTESTSQLINLFAEIAPEEMPVEPVVLTEFVQPETLDDAELDNSMQQVIDIVEDQAVDLLAADLTNEFKLNLLPTAADFESLVNPGEFGGRSSIGKRAALKKYGGTVESERAVDAGLRWLLTIQRSDGSWDFSAVGNSAQPGFLNDADTGATALALLCFLGAGHTHLSSGQYQDAVARGLRSLMTSARVADGEADLRGGNQGNSGMYVQGIATICLCEAHALEPGDYKLERLARKAIRFIEDSQHPSGGGWRYKPREAGDTSVVGWQVMALQSARTGSIQVSRKALRGAGYFLDRVQTRNGAEYKYTPGRGRSATPTMTAVGLLCRMYLGWKHDNSILERGVAGLSAKGPSPVDMYYNYYATQVLHHWGGKDWKRWNKIMREGLIRTQIEDGQAAGSWPVMGPHAGAGGQLYQTTLCLLTLEVYYRHLPMYRHLQN